jgi:hypothetical protein
VHGIAAEHNAETQRCVVVSQVPVGQSLFALQPHAPATQAVPIVLPAQLTHAAPLAPHSLAAVPLTQVPPVQQPPLHGELALQPATQLCVVVLQAEPLGQSLGPLQPQLPATHAWPAVAAVQSLQVPLPHALGALPDAHWPLAAQQPPLHGWVALQLEVQWLVATSHA